MREKQIPVDSVEVKDNVQAFAWEPIGTKFAIIHGESQSMTVSTNILFFRENTKNIIANNMNMMKIPLEIACQVLLGQLHEPRGFPN